MALNLITIFGYIMNTRETLILKTLELKAFHEGSNMGGIVDALLDQNPEAASKLTKNVCAHVPIALANEMDQLGGLIGLNKREMITMALHDFLDKARGVIDEFDAMAAVVGEG